tara:strand:- start:5156 stop:5461 length:306 start_codon:yes stop_codon:yes gene_type:complete
MTYLIISLVLSLALNILFLWYIRKILYKLLFVSDNIDELLESARNFSEHLERIYNMETYYGDEVIKNLVEHSKGLVIELGEFEKIYVPSLDEGEEYAEKIE